MDKNKILEDSERIINDIIKILNNQFNELKKSGYGEQKISDLKRGLVQKNGIYIPLSSIDHRILFDGYETSLLETYIELYDNLFKKWNESFAQFALRTLAEIGFTKTQILFDKNIDIKEKNKYKLLLWLADYASMSGENPKYKITYNKLLKEYQNLLTVRELAFYTSLINQPISQTPLENYESLKKARSKINDLQSTLYSKTKTSTVFRKINIVALFSSFSHILHGNVLLIKDILELKRPDAQKLRIYWALLLTGINVINQIGIYLKDADMNTSIDKITKDFTELSEQVKNNWSSL